MHKFRVSVNDDQYEEILRYNDTLNFIVGHQGPLHSSDCGYSNNVMIKWETGEIMAEPLTMIAADDLVTCAIYARE